MKGLLLGVCWAHLASCVLLVGAFFVLLLASRPMATTARCWDRRLVRWSRLLVFVAVGSGIVWLLVRTAIFENRPQAALEPGAVWHAVLDTWPGLVWLARHGLLIVLGVFLAMRASVAERRDWLAARGEALTLATLALALMSASSHAAAITPGTTLAVAVDVTHVVGTGLWVGGLVALALLLRAASREDGADARPYAVLAARRFSRAALIVMLLLVASGALNAIAQVESVAALAGTTHGRLLLAKLVVLVLILVLAAVNRTRILPALSAPSVPVERSTMRRLTTFVGLEAALALILLMLAAAMTLTTPARHAEPAWPLADLRSPPTSRRHAGEIFWLISHGTSERGMPEFRSRLGEAPRWDVINFIRALGAAEGAKTLGSQVDLDRAWLAAPDFTVAVGPLAPGALRDHRGRRMVLLVLYTLPESRARMTELALSYDVLSVIGVEIIAVPIHASSEAIRELGSSPPVLFPVVTDGSGDIVTTYGMFAPGPHAEILIDRQGYIRAIWRGDGGGMPRASMVQAQVEKLNEEKSPPPFPDDHVH